MDPVRMDGAVVSKYRWLADAFNKNNESKEASNAQDNEGLITLKLREAKWEHLCERALDSWGGIFTTINVL